MAISRHLRAVVWWRVLSACCLCAGCAPTAEAPARLAAPATAPSTRAASFAGPVRLLLPPVVYAAPGVECNLYFDNVVLVLNPANHAFDVTCPKGQQYDERWTFTPKPEDAGEHPLLLEVRDDTNAVIARAETVVRVAPADAGGEVTLLAIGDSHLQKDTYLQTVLDLSKRDPALGLTLVGSRGRGNKPPSDDLRHEGYNGWTAEAFATRNRPKPRTGFYVPAETGSPFIYVDAEGKPGLDLSKYCGEFNGGKPLDFVLIELGGNDVWRATDEDIDQTIDKVLGFFDQLVAMVRAHSPGTRIGIVMLEPLSRSQHGYRNYAGPRKQTRWQYRRNQHRMAERQVERYAGREAEGLYLLPVGLNVDTTHGFPTRPFPTNARMPATQQRVLDGSHFSTEGYMQYGDPIFCWIKCALARPSRPL